MHSGVEVTLNPGDSIETSVTKDRNYTAAKNYKIIHNQEVVE